MFFQAQQLMDADLLDSLSTLDTTPQQPQPKNAMGTASITTSSTSTSSTQHHHHPHVHNKVDVFKPIHPAAPETAAGAGTETESFHGERKRRASADPDKFTQPKRPATWVDKHALNNNKKVAWNSDTDGEKTRTKPLDGVREEEESHNRVVLDKASNEKQQPAGSGSRNNTATTIVSITVSSNTSSNNDNDKFRNPGDVVPPGVLKRGKKKHRPEPLIIPPHVNTAFGFQSRLRSPRLWDPSHKQGCTPPPYTPPPMLSPVRSGSGLFWKLNSASVYGPITPKSAPVFVRGLRRPSMSSGSGTSVSEETEEDMEEQPPETDIQP